MTAERATFTRMQDGVKEEYDILVRHEEKFCEGLADRILDHMKLLVNGPGGYAINRLEHSLQSATRSEADGADLDWIVTAFLHDIGDMLAPLHHDSMAAAILQPYVREECIWVLRHHGLYQLKYYGEHVGEDPDGRDKHKDHPYHNACITFCERWDENCFDPHYENKPFEHFEPMVREVFARKAWDPAVIKVGQQGVMQS